MCLHTHTFAHMCMYALTYTHSHLLIACTNVHAHPEISLLALPHYVICPGDSVGQPESDSPLIS